MTANVVSHRNIWLCNWEVDSGSQNRLVGLPFQGAKLFGHALEPILVESKDKKRMLPTSTKKEVTKTKKQFFRFSRPDLRTRDNQKSRGKWNKSQFFPKGRSQDSAISKTSNDQRRA